jgi:hypothetical protein
VVVGQVALVRLFLVEGPVLLSVVELPAAGAGRVVHGQDVHVTFDGTCRLHRCERLPDACRHGGHRRVRREQRLPGGRGQEPAFRQRNGG